MPISRSASVDEVHGRPREHRAADAVHVARDDVQRVDQPVGQRARLLLADAHPPVGHGARSGRELARQPLDLAGLDARVGGGALGRPLLGQGAQLATGRRSARRGRPRRTRPSAKITFEHPQQQVGIAAGAHRDVLGGVLGGLGAAGVDHDHLPAPRADRLDLLAHRRARS